MEPKDDYQRMCLALRRLLDRNHGHKGEVDRALGHNQGHMRRKLATDKVYLAEVFGTLKTLRVGAGEFFAEVFDYLPGPEQLLRRQEKPGKPGRSLGRIEKAALALEAEVARDEAGAGAQAPATAATRSRQQLEKLVRTGVDNQRKVLRKQSWVRYPASLRRYLEQLDGLRFDRVDDAAALAETVAVEILNGVIGRPEERLALMCHAIGAFASAGRVAAEFASAARALGFGLRLAGRHGLATARADLLQRGAYVLRDAGYFDHALELLDEALVLWAEQGRSAEIGKTLVDRAIVFGHKEEFLRADRVFKIGLGYLCGNTETHRMFRLAAAHGIAFTQLRMGDAREANRWLDRAIELVSDAEPTALAKLIRQKGEIYYQREQFPEAERAFASAHKVLMVKENAIQGAYAALDLAAALEAQGKYGEIKELAESMIPMLALFDDNRLAGAALLAFIRAAQDGSVTEDLITEVGKKLGRSRPLTRARRLRTSHLDR